MDIHEYEKLILEAKEIVARGCNCDRQCKELLGLDVYCGCANDARQIIELALFRAGARGEVP